MPSVKKLLVFLSSPGDVQTERRHVKDIVEELNRTVASDKGLVLQVMSWEVDAYPGYGTDAQAIINAQLAEMSRYALFIGIMWNRLGSPTPRADSGTVEEFQRAVQAHSQGGQPDIWFYFRDTTANPDTAEQLEQQKKVLAFKEQVKAKGLPWTYKKPSDFRNSFRNQMVLWLNARTRKREMGEQSVPTLIDIKTEPSTPIIRDPSSADSGEKQAKQPRVTSSGMTELQKAHITSDVPTMDSGSRAVLPSRAPSRPDIFVIDAPFHLELVYVPAGEFLMGSDPVIDKRAFKNELPQHRVNLSEFYIGQYPVTNAQYAVFTKTHKKRHNASVIEDDYPVVRVSCRDAAAFCEWLSSTTGKRFRLPTEAEWEKAARGVGGGIYPWGNEWAHAKLNSSESGIGGTTPVGEYSPAGDSPYGVAGMAGNVWEWTCSLYRPYPYRVNDGREFPKGEGAGDFVFRGGSFGHNGRFARCAYRGKGDPDFRFDYFGFRVVMSIA